MATTKKMTKKKNVLDADQIIALYMDFVLSTDQTPNSVYSFCQANEMDEADFYSHFGSFDSVKQIIWVKFFENARAIIDRDIEFPTYTDKNKLLTLFYTLFEVLTLNRSYVLYSLKGNKEGLKNLKDLRQFRTHFKRFVQTIIEANQDKGFAKLDTITKPVFSEGAWIQWLFILKFWMEDVSPSFEKTDIVIEKSINTVVDLLNTKPLESLIDLGKFLWKERRM